MNTGAGVGVAQFSASLRRSLLVTGFHSALRSQACEITARNCNEIEREIGWFREDMALCHVAGGVQ
jgi:hypothetical protein